MRIMIKEKEWEKEYEENEEKLDSMDVDEYMANESPMGER